MTAPPDLREFDEKIADVRRKKEGAIDAQDFEVAASLRDGEKMLIAAKAEREKQWKAGDMDVVAEVDEELIAEVLATATGIPIVKLTEEESGRLLRMEDELHKRVIGQDAAVKALSRAIRRTRAGLKDPKRPGGSFIFAGPSGVGKTWLSKTLAEFLFGDEDSLIQLDMSEFSEKHTISRLFGSPPGYVGYEEGGQLTEKVRRKPFSVVLFDEVEKAHPDIFNSLLQILEEGRLTDSQGRVVDFKNTVIIMTTNLGTKDISRGSTNLGFHQSGDIGGSYERMKNKVSEELKQHFRPEFLNRVDEIIVFPPLTKDEIIAMVDYMIDSVELRLKDRDMGLELTQAAKELLATRGFDPVLGARPLRRTVQRDLEDVLAEKMLYGEVGTRADRARRRGRHRQREPLLVRRDAEVGAAGCTAGRRGRAGHGHRDLRKRQRALAHPHDETIVEKGGEGSFALQGLVPRRDHGAGVHGPGRVAQDGEDPAPALPVGARVGLDAAAPGRVRIARGTPRAHRRHRTAATRRVAHRAHQRAELHRRDAPRRGDARVVRKERDRQLSLRPGERERRERATGRHPAQDATDVGVEDGDALAEGEGPHRRGGVLADAGQGPQVGVGRGHRAVVPLVDQAGGRVQPEGSSGIAEAAPHPHRLAGAVRRQRGRRRPPGQPPDVRRQHPADRRLLQHDLADQHAPGRGVGPAPGQIPRMGVVPAQQRLVDKGFGHVEAMMPWMSDRRA